ncbi:MAG: HAMP domain-containing sensor histidine kinase [Acidobacteria bacterium]|nr:HAMP domain-containing sensor histidine kinase [Acidobacteriota bacterium]
MSLRTRLILTTLAVAVPLAGVLFLLAERTRSADMDATIDRLLESSDCGPGGQGPAGGGPGGRRPPVEVHPYTADFVSSRPDGRGPAFPSDLRAQLTIVDRAAGTWSMSEGRGRQIALRLPDQTGRCQILLGRMRPRHGELREQLIGLGSVVLVVFLAVTLAAGPTVARIHQLAEHVRRSPATSTADAPSLTLRGNDEVAALSSAFVEARHAVRTHLDEVEARERALREFVANTTHDIAIPLTVLQTDLSALEDTTAGAQADHVRSAMREAHYMGSLLRNLAAASRLDGGVALDLRPLDLNAVVERVIARHQPLARASGVDLNMAVPTAPTIGTADATLAEQAIGNLVDNAVRYNTSGGHVAVVLDHTPEGFTLRVSDDGAGVDEAELPLLATRRFRGGAARSRRPDGQGLGLAITAEAAATFGWHLTFTANIPTGLTCAMTGARIAH